uniref:Large ribosomal subunit protein uL23c n=1 Tax=Calypogeia fissa TaxID=362796 RepID=A0A4Y5P7E8_CALFD|nr:ribosomal protein L23 [Calypogeia fissa]QCW59212.1 ribosomal protein L23 [Calypogeia fissa]
MDKIGYPVLTEKTIRLLERNQYSFDVDVRSDKTEIKKWIESFFDVQIRGMNSHRLPRKKKRMGAVTGYTVRYKRMIVTLKLGYSIPLFSSK